MKHSLINVHPDAKIAKNVKIEPFATIQGDVEIGEGTEIRANAVIMDGARIGKNVTVFPGAVVAGEPQDLKFRGEKSIAIIGDNTIIRECVTINRGTAAKGKTVIGNNCVLMAYTHIAHDCIIGNNVIIANCVQIAGEVDIDDFAILGGGILVHQFVKIGSHVMIQGGLKTQKDIPPYIKAAREPASYTGVNTIGLRRRGFTNDEITHIQDIYRILYNQGLNNTDALNKICEEVEETKFKKEIIDFFKKSERGIVPSFLNNRK